MYLTIVSRDSAFYESYCNTRLTIPAFVGLLVFIMTYPRYPVFNHEEFSSRPQHNDSGNLPCSKRTLKYMCHNFKNPLQCENPYTVYHSLTHWSNSARNIPFMSSTISQRPRRFSKTSSNGRRSYWYFSIVSALDLSIYLTKLQRNLQQYGKWKSAAKLQNKTHAVDAFMPWTSGYPTVIFFKLILPAFSCNLEFT